MVGVGTTIRGSGPVERVRSSTPVLGIPQAARASKEKRSSTKFEPTIALITNVDCATRAGICAVGDASCGKKRVKFGAGDDWFLIPIFFALRLLLGAPINAFQVLGLVR